MTNALLRVPPPESATARRHVALAFENMLASVLDETSVSAAAGFAPHRDGVFTAAVAAIEARFREPGLTVSQLAKELTISVRTLHHAFTRMGSTPRREIERRRTTEAQRLLTQHLTRAEAAARAGFASPRQLSRALHRDRVPGDLHPAPRPPGWRRHRQVRDVDCPPARRFGPSTPPLADGKEART